MKKISKTLFVSMLFCVAGFASADPVGYINIQGGATTIKWFDAGKAVESGFEEPFTLETNEVFVGFSAHLSRPCGGESTTIGYYSGGDEVKIPGANSSTASAHYAAVIRNTATGEEREVYVNNASWTRNPKESIPWNIDADGGVSYNQGTVSYTPSAFGIGGMTRAVTVHLNSDIIYGFREASGTPVCDIQPGDVAMVVIASGNNKTPGFASLDKDGNYVVTFQNILSGFEFNVELWLNNGKVLILDTRIYKPGNGIVLQPTPIGFSTMRTYLPSY